jgi:DNA repair protein RAD7
LLEHVGSYLKTLVLNENYNLADRTLTEGIRPHCPNLRHLGLHLLAEITPEGIIGLFQGWSENPGLELLDLSRCIEVDDKGIAAIVEHSGRTLVNLNMNSVDKDVTEEGLKTIAGGCEAVERLDLGFVRAVDDFSLKEIMDKCSKLTWVSVFGCNRITVSLFAFPLDSSSFILDRTTRLRKLASGWWEEKGISRFTIDRRGGVRISVGWRATIFFLEWQL